MGLKNLPASLDYAIEDLEHAKKILKQRRAAFNQAKEALDEASRNAELRILIFKAEYLKYKGWIPVANFPGSKGGAMWKKDYPDGIVLELQEALEWQNTQDTLDER